MKKTKNTVPWIYLISDLNGEQLWEVFMKKNCKRLIKKNLELKKNTENKRKQIICQTERT